MGARLDPSNPIILALELFKLDGEASIFDPSGNEFFKTYF